MSMQTTIDVVNNSKMSHADKAKITRLLMLISRSSSELTGFGLRLAREAAGLSVGQAAALLAVSQSDVQFLESAAWDSADGPRSDLELVKTLDRVYGLGD